MLGSLRSVTSNEVDSVHQYYCDANPRVMPAAGATSVDVVSRLRRCRVNIRSPHVCLAANAGAVFSTAAVDR